MERSVVAGKFHLLDSVSEWAIRRWSDGAKRQKPRSGYIQQLRALALGWRKKKIVLKG